MKYPEDVTIFYSGARLDTGGDGNFAIFVDSEIDYQVAETAEDLIRFLKGLYGLTPGVVLPEMEE